jgi:hypothetical protein
MTTRNMNKTWRDILIQQYEQDYADNAPFPIRYLINVPEHGHDLWWEIDSRIEPATFRQAILAWHLATRGINNPAYEDENIRVTTRQ